MLQHAVSAFLVAGIIAPFSWYMGNVARLLKLPQISGYLISGVICGPYALGLLTTEAVTDLNIVEGACLSIIGLAAGAELHLPELNKSRKQVRAACTRWFSPLRSQDRRGADHSLVTSTAELSRPSTAAVRQPEPPSCPRCRSHCSPSPCAASRGSSATWRCFQRANMSPPWLTWTGATSSQSPRWARRS